MMAFPTGRSFSSCPPRLPQFAASLCSYSKSAVFDSQPKSTVGTPAYIAPEVLSRKQVRHASAAPCSAGCSPPGSTPGASCMPPRWWLPLLARRRRLLPLSLCSMTARLQMCGRAG